MMSAGSSVTKTVWQYSEPLPEETMEFLRGIASDYRKVKNCVYERYSGIGSLDRLTPVYGILNEMRYCGLREQLNLPAVYYELAITDAVTDIKAGWGTVRNRIGGDVTAGGSLSADDKKYIRTVLKLNQVYASILNRRKYEMPKNTEGLVIDVKRLNNLLCRLTRKYLTRPETERDNFFRISPNGYSYKDGSLCIVCRVPRKRVAIPLKDGRMFDRQMQIHVREDSVALAVPVETKVKLHGDYANTVYIHIGYKDMFTLSDGTVYGEALDGLVSPETERLARKNRERYRMYTAYGQNMEKGNLRKAEHIEANNLGTFKYDRQKEKERNRTATFINAEINRMIRMEKPSKVVIAKQAAKGGNRKHSNAVNRKFTRSFQGYIRDRLAYKCRLHSIELEEVYPKGTGGICSFCGAEGRRQGFLFVCEHCGNETTVSLNSAQNIERKYKESVRTEG